MLLMLPKDLRKALIMDSMSFAASLITIVSVKGSIIACEGSQGIVSFEGVVWVS